MSRHQKAISGGLLAGLGLGTAMALVLHIALAQLTLNRSGNTPFPSGGLVTFLSLAAGLGVGLGRGMMAVSLAREDTPPPSP